MGGETGRRDFLFGAVAAGSAWVLATGCGDATRTASQRAGSSDSPRLAPKEIRPPAIETVRVGLAGVGDRGIYLLQLLLAMEGVQVRAVCDVVPAKIGRAQRLFDDRRLPKPECFDRGETDYRRMCDSDDLDLIVNAVPWQLHNAVTLAALGAGKHVATEVPAATSVEECWQQVESAQQANRHCVLLENYCYQRDVLMIWGMVRRGLFGEVMHAEGGYQKDARDSDLRLSADGTLAWTGQFRSTRKGNVYPTHDLGPIAQWLDIHRGDRFDYLVSMGGNARAINEYGAERFGPDHFLATTRFDMADINLCLIRTVKGRTAYLISDTLTGRPQPRNLYRLLGSKGIYDRTIDKLYLTGKSPQRDHGRGEWEPVVKYYEEFDHPLWRELLSKSIGGGLGSGDYLCLYRYIKALRTGVRPDFDVHDAAAWSSVVELSERSACNRSQPVDFPDFTRGRWQTTEPLPLASGT